jgi:hypothetical protein
MRFHDKLDQLRAMRPDVAVVPECACPEVLLRRTDAFDVADLAWEGVNPQKGLAILSFGPWRLTVDPRHRLTAGTTLPVHVSGPASFRLLGVWGLPRWGHRPRRTRPEPLLDGFERLAGFVRQRPAIVAGDFNSTLTTRGGASPSALARRLDEEGFVSAHHTEPTFFRHRRLPGRHHADHVFVDAALADLLLAVEVGSGLQWILESDHAPVVAELEIGGSA